MKKSKSIALCGISAAFGSILLYIVIIAPTIKLSIFALSSVAIMIPLSKKLYSGAALTMLATSAIGFIAGGLLVFLPYILVFGIHPLINELLSKTKLSIIIQVAIKLLYFNGILYLLYSLATLAELFLVIVNFLPLALIVSAAFIPYDFLMQSVQKRVNYIIEKHIKL